MILAALGTTVPLLSHGAEMEPFADAEQKLRAAWAQKKSHDVAGNLGAALLKLGDPVQAARFLAYAVEHHPVGGKPSVKKLTEELLAEAKAKAVEVRLRITGDAPAPAIRVDGTPVEAALVGDRIFIAPGERVLEASAKGYPTAQKTVNAKEGQSVEVELKLVPAEAAAPRSKVPAFVLGGVGVAALGVGIGLGVAAADKASAADQKLDEIRRTPNAGPCPPVPSTGLCGQLADLNRGHDQLRDASVGLFVSAGVVAAATAAYMAWAWSRPVRAGFLVGPQGTGIVVQGAF